MIDIRSRGKETACLPGSNGNTKAQPYEILGCTDRPSIGDGYPTGCSVSRRGTPHSSRGKYNTDVEAFSYSTRPVDVVSPPVVINTEVRKKGNRDIVIRRTSRFTIASVSARSQ
jgi:hypothetical protein